jgi:hypothetical protein
LQDAILMLDREILDAEQLKLDRDRSDHERQQARKDEQEKRHQLEPVMAWRRELERMLRQADYEKGRQGSRKRRPTGPKVQLPEFKLSWFDLPPDERRAAITSAAVSHRFAVAQ